jgi:hypothetical protein
MKRGKRACEGKVERQDFQEACVKIANLREVLPKMIEIARLREITQN